MSERTVEARLDRLEEWRDAVHAAIDRLVRDQDYRDHRNRDRRLTWKIWGVRLGGLAAIATLLGTAIQAVVEGLHLLGL